jgi:uncharacterized protein YwgA
LNSVKAKEITQKQFIRLFKTSKDKSSKIRFGFILGAGASVSSGIKAGGYFAKKWFDEIKEDIDEASLKEWSDALNDFSENNLAQHYTDIFEKRFEANYEEGYEKLQKEMDKATPSVGYSFLAQILNETHNKFVITTNFDTMTEDALFQFKKSRPLVLGHEYLSYFINTTAPTRPTIIKIHRDFLLDPYNKPSDISTLDAQWKKSLEPVLKENAMVVIGYGGNDNSLMNYLTNIDERKPIYWCYRDESELSDKIKNLLNEKDYLVKIKGFDKFMLLLNDGLDFEHLTDRDNIENSQIVKNAIEFAEEHKKQLEELIKNDGLDDEEQKAVKKLLPSWWEYQMAADAEKNINKKEEIYLEGLKTFPESHELTGNFAVFLYKTKKDLNKSEKYYIKALRLKPLDYIHNGNYAIFLHCIKKEYDKAQIYYLKSLKSNPHHTNANVNYASILLSIGKKDEAILYIDNAFKYVTTEKDIIIELWFYRLAHFPEYYHIAIKELDRLLADGHKSIGWDFSQNIERAKKDGFKDIELLEKYAKRITEKDS